MTDHETKIVIITADERVREVLQFCFEGWGYKVIVHDSGAEDIESIKRISPDVIVLDVHSAHKRDLNLCRLLKEDFITAMIPVITMINKRHLRDHLLNLTHGVDDYVIKPPDPLDLRVRIEMAIRRSRYNLYASSLTGLPGARLIEESLKDLLKKDKQFTFAYVDIDNFKYFNDGYGYVKGDYAILQTAYILYSVIRRHGTKDDLIGHIGGDDFVFITSTEQAPVVAGEIIQRFDSVMAFHYGLEDRRRGFIIARDRTHTITRVPLMSLSIALVNRDHHSPLASMVMLNDRIAEVKKYLKGLQGSKYMLDRREKEIGDITPVLFQKNAYQHSTYKPLGQLMLDRQMITPDQLHEALHMHWKKGIVIGEILKELGYIDAQGIERLLEHQKVAYNHQTFLSIE